MRKMAKVDHGKEAKVSRRNPKRNIVKSIQEKNPTAKKSTGVHDERAPHQEGNLRKN